MVRGAGFRSFLLTASTGAFGPVRSLLDSAEKGRSEPIVLKNSDFGADW